MKLSDFDGMEDHGERELTSWDVGTEHPRVRTYHNPKTNETYQVCSKYKKYRKTPPTDDIYEVNNFEDWLDLD